MTFPPRFILTTTLGSRRWEASILPLVGKYYFSAGWLSPKSTAVSVRNPWTTKLVVKDYSESRISPRQHFYLPTPRLILTIFEDMLSCISERNIKPCKSSPVKDEEQLEITCRCCKRYNSDGKYQEIKICDKNHYKIMCSSSSTNWTIIFVTQLVHCHAITY